MCVPKYPVFATLSLEHRAELEPFFEKSDSGISEFTFPSLFVHRTKYSYQISCSGPGQYIFTAGIRGKKYFFTPFKIPEPMVLERLFFDFDTWNLISGEQFLLFSDIAGLDRSVFEQSAFYNSSPEESCLLMEGETGAKIPLEFSGIKLLANENKKNWDYIYKREKLATLSGKMLHKKKNLVNQFSRLYSPEFRILESGNDSIGHALSVLEEWHKERENFEDKSFYDYYPAKEALENFSSLGFSGAIVYIDGIPAGFTIGEKIPGISHYAVHFEKGLTRFKGIYQYLNHAYARLLPEDIEFVNREQDLGDEGLRQAKLSYKPCGMIKKFSISRL